MSISRFLLQIAKSWPDYASGKTIDSTNYADRLVSVDFPCELRRLTSEIATLQIDGSSGQGNVSNAPWVATFDTRITSSAQQGFYPVYIFSCDFKRVYLSLSIGLTQFDKYYGENKRSLNKLKESTEYFRSVLFRHNNPPGFDNTKIDIASSIGGRKYVGYEAGTIFSYPAYQLSALPEDSVLQDEYLQVVRFYKELIEDPTVPNVDELVEATISQAPALTQLGIENFSPREPKRRKGNSYVGENKRRSTESLKVGNAGELIVLKAEKEKLTKAGRADLADRVDHLAARNEKPGWDISSFDLDGTPIYIEVKASKGKTISSVELTRNEWNAARNKSRSPYYHIYIVTDALGENPKIEALTNPYKYVEDKILSIEESCYELSLRQLTLSNSS